MTAPQSLPISFTLHADTGEGADPSALASASVWRLAQHARNADAKALADLLRATRARTLALLGAYSSETGH